MITPHRLVSNHAMLFFTLWTDASIYFSALIRLNVWKLDILSNIHAASLVDWPTKQELTIHTALQFLGIYTLEASNSAYLK